MHCVLNIAIVVYKTTTFFSGVFIKRNCSYHSRSPLQQHGQHLRTNDNGNFILFYGIQNENLNEKYDEYRSFVNEMLYLF